MTEKDKAELFGKGSMQPDVMKIPTSQQLMQNNMSQMQEQEDYSQL